ncbi:hypothetical protein [Streptomyces spiramenti]|uniref:Uncharacterized protein n=1 Tax=Streptomyces spiramenti TaxID=2720606 RepID=A0ABX1AP35_9ACTN|nr:hypothetical protein [Streptomyces spiramenti]NJP66423.1 hypothetical protein [Streptomyces spiramenti]
MNGGYRFARFQLVRRSGPLVFRVQCEVCAEIGPQAETGDAAMMWAVLPRGDQPAEQCQYATPVPAVFREWAAGTEFRAVQCAALADGQPISANARGPDRVCGSADVEVLYSLAARPILRPVLAPFGSSSVDPR